MSARFDREDLRPPPSPHAAPAGRPHAPRPAVQPRRRAPWSASPRRTSPAAPSSRRRAAGWWSPPAASPLLFGAVGLKLAVATIIDPMQPRLRAAPRGCRTGDAAMSAAPPITDRNGEILAISLQITELYANPQEINDPDEAADRLLTRAAQPRPRTADRPHHPAHVPSSERPVQFAYIARNLPPRQQQAINNLGIPGFYFRAAERRLYPQGRPPAHVLGGVDVDGRASPGSRRSFDERLRDRPAAPLRLSLDVRVQVALRESGAQGDRRLQRHRRRRHGDGRATPPR